MHTGSFLDRLSFAQLRALFAVGAAKKLEQSDLPPLPREESSDELSRTAYRVWDAGPGKGSLFRALWAVARRPLLLSAPIALLDVVLALTLPLILRALLEWIAAPGDSTGPLRGAGLVALLFAVRLLSTSVLGPQEMAMCKRAGVRAERAAMLLVSRKLMRLRSGTRGTGELVTAIAQDAKRLGPDVIAYTHLLWNGPLQIVLATALLFHFIGSAAIGALAVMLCTSLLMFTVVGSERVLYDAVYKRSDHRMRALAGMLDVLRQAKMSAWEDVLAREVRTHRDEQMKILRKATIVEAMAYSLWDTAPALTGIAAFWCAGITPGAPQLTSEVVFPCLAVIETMKVPLNLMPIVSAYLMQSVVSLYRLQSFLEEDEYQGRAQVETGRDANAAGGLRGGTLGWVNVKRDDGSSLKDSDDSVLPEQRSLIESHTASTEYGTVGDEDLCEKGIAADHPTGFVPVLRNLQLTLEKGSLTIVRGPVGSGKSALLSALLGEMTHVSSHSMPSALPWLRGACVAYTSQSPWIQNASLRENVLFRPSEETASLVPVNEGRYRATLAACGLQRDISEMLAGDATEIGERGTTLSGGQRARVALARAVYADAEVYLLDDPLSALDVHVGAHVFEAVLAPGGLLAGRTRVLVTHRDNLCARADWVVTMEAGQVSHVCRGGSDALSVSPVPGEKRGAQKNEAAEDESSKPTDGALVEEEHRETGNVGLRLYAWYLLLSGLSFPTFAVAGIIAMHVVFLGADFWLGVFASATEAFVSDKGTGVALPVDIAMWYIRVYLAISVSAGLVQLVTEVIISTGFVRCSIKAHELLLVSVLSAPVAWLDSTPVGRILSRFSADMMTLDSGLREQISALADIGIRVFITYAVIAAVTPVILLAAPPLLFIYMRILHHYGATKRAVARLDSTRNSIVFSRFSEFAAGLPVVRAFGKQGAALQKLCEVIDDSSRASLPNNVAAQMLTSQVSAVSSVVVLTAAAAAAAARGAISPALAGLCLTWALRLANPMPYLSYVWAQVDSDMIVVERIHEFTYKIPSEKLKVHGDRDAELKRTGWPQRGEVEFKGVQMRYRDNTPIVLKELDLRIPAGKTVGVIGRTGAGKSSILNVLLRMTELCGGCVRIDGVDISEVGLGLLRSSVMCVPQDPGLFRGTLRANMDPRGAFSELDVARALELVGMHKTHTLGFEVAHTGANLSAGERQLVCVARALLARARVVVLDEASSYVDYERDRALQGALRGGLEGSTLFIIAHRIRTVAECDLVVVMDAGRVVEGPRTPREMLADENSRLFALAAEMGESALRELRAAAAKAGAA